MAAPASAESRGSGNQTDLLSGNKAIELSGNRVSIFSNIKIEIHISNSGNNNGGKGH